MQLIQTFPDGSPREVELTPDECRANERWNELLDNGAGIVEAAEQVEREHPGLDPAFYDYLRR